MNRSYHDYDARLVGIARRLRRGGTFPERLLWSRLRRRQLGVRFLRQHPIGTYVVDFYCPEARLVIEVDGRSHDEANFAYYRERQITLERRGIRVMRIRNDEVLKDVDSIVARLRDWMEERAHGDRSPLSTPDDDAGAQV